jgi:metal-dependent hydrolase (beta-lactamase superfamily II)
LCCHFLLLQRSQSATLQALDEACSEEEHIILETVDALEAFDLQLIAAAHCTGWRALGQLAQRFWDRVVQSAVGKRFVL